MNTEDKKFLEECDEFKDYTTIEEYISDIRHWLLLSGMAKNSDEVNGFLNDPVRKHWIEEAFTKKEPASEIAADVGFYCG